MTYAAVAAAPASLTSRVVAGAANGGMAKKCALSPLMSKPRRRRNRRGLGPQRIAHRHDGAPSILLNEDLSERLAVVGHALPWCGSRQPLVYRRLLEQACAKPVADERVPAHPDNPIMTASPARRLILSPAPTLLPLASLALANRPSAKATP